MKPSISCRRFLIPALFALAASGCATPQATLSESDRELGRTVGIADEQLLAIKQSGANLRQLEGLSDGGEPLFAPGVTIDVSERKALPTVKHLRRALGEGSLVFVSERNYGIGGALDEVSVLQGTDFYDALRTMGTNGWNYDLGPDDVIERLKLWDAKYGLDIQGIAFDWVEARIERPPTDMASFAAEVYEFCPDVVEQGAGTVEALADEMRRSQLLYLWWD